jgi:hypothetical protein
VKFADGHEVNDPTLRQERFIIASTAKRPPEAGVESDVLASVYRESEYIVLMPTPSLSDGLQAVEQLSLTGVMTSVRMYLVSRDYGMSDRKEAPQYYPPAKP